MSRKDILTRENILETITQAIRELGKTPNVDETNENTTKINENTTKEELNLDSLDMMELVMKIEEKFGIQLQDKEAQEIKDVKTIIDIVESKIQSPTPRQ